MDIEAKIYFDNSETEEKKCFRIDLLKESKKDIPCVTYFFNSKKIHLIKSPDTEYFDLEDIPFLKEALFFIEKHIK